MDSKKLEILITAVDLGSFSKAAEVVGYTQSGLTHLVDSLEREIGLTLVQRDHSGISLTKEGEALMPVIREFLRANAKLENQIAAITENQTQTIRIAAYASLAMHWMPEILYRFRRVCPEVTVDLRMVDHALEPRVRGKRLRVLEALIIQYDRVELVPIHKRSDLAEELAAAHRGKIERALKAQRLHILI